MQGYFARHPERWANSDALIRHDAAFFRATAEEALRSAARFSAEFVHRLEPVARRYDAAVRVMAAQPKTFVHGTYRPAQIIVDRACQPTRFCPVDWEKAAVGSPLYDLTFLADGFEPPRLDQVLDAYRAEAEGHGVAVCEADEMKHVMDCLRLHRTMNWLSLAADRRFPEAKVVKLLDRAEEVGRLVL
jgi:aminoglycoside phosphotransferase (APT) family kinase protein